MKYIQSENYTLIHYTVTFLFYAWVVSNYPNDSCLPCTVAPWFANLMHFKMVHTPKIPIRNYVNRIIIIGGAEWMNKNTFYTEY